MNAPDEKPISPEEVKVKPEAPVTPPRYNLDRDFLERICLITQVRGSGPGGQHRNKAFTGVRLKHPPSGAVVTATERRSFHQNRDIAFERLIERLLGLMRRKKPRRPTRVPKGLKKRRLENKKRRGEVKKTRGKVDF